MNLSFTFIDFLVVTVIVVSAAYAAYRGLMSETLTIFAWAAAAFATLYFGPWLVPMARSMIARWSPARMSSRFSPSDSRSRSSAPLRSISWGQTTTTTMLGVVTDGGVA